METVGWLAVLLLSVTASGIAAYLFGYKCGHDDATDGLSRD